MTALSLAISLAIQNTVAQAEPPTPAQEIIKVIERYQDKLCATGTIVNTITSGKSTIKVMTDLQYLRPSKLSVRQKSSSDKTAMTVSNGKAFIYKAPNFTQLEDKTEYRIEPVKELRTGNLLTVDEIFPIGSTGLLDKSTALDIVMGRKDNIGHLDRLLADLKFGEKQTINGKECTVIVGRMLEAYESDASFKVQFAFTANHDLVQIQTHQIVLGDDKGKEVAVNFVMTWDVDVKVNDEKLVIADKFILPK